MLPYANDVYVFEMKTDLRENRNPFLSERRVSVFYK